MNKIIHTAPLVFFGFLVVFLFFSLGNKNDQLESVLIDQNFPNFSLTTLEDANRIIGKEDIIDLPALVNVWATWCITCKVEHPFLMNLKENSVINIYGLNYKDSRDKALITLEQDGNPFIYSIFDKTGSLAMDLGVYGAPETFLIGADGLIKVRHVGALTPIVWEKKFSMFLK
jgi:cytochrome c biogenesis protein CcmG/thiol:disulfide interchange protein DsbE